MNALRWQPYLLYFCCNTSAMLGHWTLRLSLGWLAWKLTQSTLWTSTIVLMMWAPSGFLSSFIAVYVENWSIRKASIAINLSTMSVGIVIWLIEATVGHTLTSLISLSITFGLLIAAYHPIRLVYISVLVPKTHLASAVGLNAAAFNTCRIVGPALAGISIAQLGIAHSLAIAAFLYAPLQAILWRISLLHRKQNSQQDQQSYLERLKGGLVYALRTPEIAFMLGMVAFNGIFLRGILEILPAIVGQIFGGDASDLAVITSAGGIGSLLAGVLVGSGKIRKQQMIRLIIPAVASGMLVTASASFVQSLMSLSLVFVYVGSIVTLIGVTTQSSIQLQVDEGYRARVMTWWSTCTFGTLSLSGLLIGALGEIMPIQYALSGLAILGLGAIVFWHYRYRR